MDNDVKQKINTVDQYIGDLARKLAGGNKLLEDKLRTELKEIILNNRVENSVDEIASLLKVPFEENLETNAEPTMKARVASEELWRWVEKNNEAITAYRGDSLKTDTGKKTTKDKVGVIKEQIKNQSLADKVNKVYAENEIEYQADTTLKDTNNEPVGVIYNNPNVTHRVDVLSEQTLKQYGTTNLNQEKITTGITDEPSNLATSGVALLKKSTSDMLSKLKMGAKKNLGKGFDKVGGSLIKGLNSTVSLTNKLTGSLGIKTVAPILIGFFVVFILISMMTIIKASPLVPRIESDEIGDGNEVGKPPTHGEITILEDGRIKSCGVGMGADFLRKTHKTWVTSGVLAGGGYDKQLEEIIGDQFGKRCGVVYAAQYLASDFEYWVPYYWAGKYYSKGLNPNWGGETKPDLKGRHLTGLDCSGFVGWASINGSGGRGGSSGAISFGNCEAIKAAIQPGDTITMPSGEPYHVALVLEYDNDKIKFAHSGGGSGVTTGWIDICSGKGLDQGMQFGYLHKKTY